MRIFIVLFLWISYGATAQVVCTTENQVRLDSTLQALSKMDTKNKPINDLVLKIGTSFLNTTYVEKTLEVEGDEKLVINLTGLDCATYLETIISLSRIAKKQVFTRQNYEEELQFLRYRDGKLDGYSSRLHYFSDWIYNNQQKGILADITKEIGGKRYKNHPSFLTENPQFYPPLVNEKFINEMKMHERDIATRTYHYIPKEDVEDHEEKIKSGDLIAITISMENLDISHVGIALEQGGRIHLLHASSSLKKVVISEEPLSEYLMDHNKQSGIMVCRLNELP